MAASKRLTAKNNTANRETGNTMKAEFAARCFAARERTPVNWRRMEGNKESQVSIEPDAAKIVQPQKSGRVLQDTTRNVLVPARLQKRDESIRDKDQQVVKSTREPCTAAVNSMGIRDNLALAKGPRDESGLQRVAIEDFSNNPVARSSAGGGTPDGQPSAWWDQALKPGGADLLEFAPCTNAGSDQAKKERYLHDSDRGCVAISLGRLAFALATEECSRWFVWTAVMGIANDRMVTRGLTCAADGLDLEVRRTERDVSSNTEGADQRETDLLGEGKFLVARLWKKDPTG
ncbi:hypothetical protein K438DRAFT_2155415 [Mycena galopus ATCC 62051]|nr:hypothetical protein K438DRAFT_2155415 [Mycena galopus ATCC 62051]